MKDYQPSKEELGHEVARLRQQVAELQSAAAAEAAAAATAAADAERSQRLADCQSSLQGRDRMIFERAADAIFIEDEDDNILDANPAASDLFGYTHAEYLAMKVTSLQAPEVRGKPGRLVREEYARYGSAIFESINLCKNGERAAVEVSLSRLDESGLTLAIVRDIRERKRARQELDESESRFRRLIENQGEGVSIITGGTLFVFANPAANQIFGVDQLAGCSVKEFLSPEQYAAIQTQLEQCQDGQKSSFEVEITQPSGAKRSLLVSASPEYDVNGRIIGIFSVFRDITERQQMEQALQDSEARYHSLFENSPISLWEEDLSEVQRYLMSLREQGVTDFRSYLNEHPEVVARCVRLIRVVDVNQATLRLYQAPSKAELAKRLVQDHPWQTSQGETGSYQTFRDELIARMEGVNFYEGEGLQFTCYGAPFYAYTSSVIAPGYEQTWGKVFFNVIDITVRKQADEERERQLARLEGLREIDHAVSIFLDLKIILDTLLTQVVNLLKVDAADVLLYDADVQTLHFGRGRGFKSSLIESTSLAQGQGYAGKAMQHRKKIYHNPLPERDPNDTKSLFVQEGFQAYFCLPLITKSQFKGVLEVYHRGPLVPDDDWLRYLEILAGQAAIAIENIQMFENLQRANADLNLAYNTTLEGWSRALDLRDKETEGHSRRVMELSLRLASAMGVRGEALIHIYRGALLHDIGKMGIPDGILLKATGLTEQEWSIMRKHPTLAFELLSPIPYLRSSLDIPYCHHERWDGTGYPRKLKGTDIPLAARIFAVVDVWDALLSDRPYRRAMPRPEVIEYIRGQRGKHFDPEVLDAFLELIQEL